MSFPKPVIDINQRAAAKAYASCVANRKCGNVLEAIKHAKLFLKVVKLEHLLKGEIKK